ncbi:MAG TPA: FAD-dependent oxidoreductase [Stellaceae bacterium]|nr:FAD-dependent oxidoreductase [Stellaceae bacterium]
MTRFASLFQPLTIKKLRIRNRFLSTSHSPGYATGGVITERYIRYQAEKSKGGVGLAQFGGATAVSPENSCYYGQIDGSTDAVVPQYRRMAAAIHAHGAACTVQLTHGGRRERWDIHNWLPTFAPSCLREVIHGSFPAEIEDHDIARIRRDFANAARRAREGDLDGVEISCQAATLIEQFWSPALNLRTDGYGGSLQNRMRFGLEVLESVRRAVGDDFVVGIRMPGDEMLEGGLSQDDCIAIARAYAGSGLIDFISVVGGQATDLKGEARIWPTMWVPSAAYLGLARAIKREVSVAILHATRIADAATAEHAVREGFVDMVGMTRAMLADPHFVAKLSRGEEASIRPCVGAGYCVDRVIKGLDAQCIHNVATGREEMLPQEVAPSAGPRRKVVVVGGGPGGLEAARVAARRGHDVVLFEAQDELGGQVLLAARATWRRELQGFVRWLAEELPRLGVAIRMNHFAEAEDVLRESPDVVVIATGGLPNPGRYAGSELATTSWDLLAGTVEPGKDVLVYDENGGAAAMSSAEFAATRGAKVTIATPDRVLGLELGGTNLGAHMNELYKYGITIKPDTRLVGLKRRDNGLVAVLSNTYREDAEELAFDQVIGDVATLPNDDLYRQLKPLSRNLGELDLSAMTEARPQEIVSNPAGKFALYRIGDAWAARNIHAATLDAMRVCVNL